MPPAYEKVKAKIYCQDCQTQSTVPFHFVGLECKACGSFNTREVERVDEGLKSGEDEEEAK